MPNQIPQVPANHPWLVPLSHLRHSLIAGANGRQREAVAAAQAAFGARLGEPELLREIARRLQQLGETRAVVACANDFAVLRGRSPAAMLELARMLVRAGFPGDALQLLQRAHAAGLPTDPSAAWVAGKCLRELGRDEDAARVLRAGIDTPDRAPMLLALSQLAPTAVVDDDELAARLAEAVAACTDEGPQLAMLLHARFAILDRQGETEAAWQALERALPLRRQQVEYDPDAASALAEHIGNQRVAAVAGEPGAGPQPVFIVGLPGTGIRHLARQLAMHPAIADAGELTDMVMALRWACDQAGGRMLDLALARGTEGIDFAGVGRAYLARTQWRAGDRAVYLDRNPDNYACIPWIMQALPGARILHVVRGPMDTCFANLARWSEREHGWSHDQAETADHYRRYRALMAHLRALYPDRIHDVRHDELASDRGAALREAVESCGLAWHEGREGAPAQPAGAPALQWRRYEAGLEPLRQRLGALAY